MHKIGVISDTHGMLRDEVKEILKTCNVILHAGDIDQEKIVKQLKEIAPLYAVRGNADKEWAEGLPASLELELYGLKIYMIHNRKTAESNNADLFIYGHSHKYEVKEENGRTWLNPGSCGRRRFTQPITMAVIEIKDDGSWKIIKKELQTQEASTALQDSAQDKAVLIRRIMKEVDRGTPVPKIASKLQITEDLASQICRMYVTHPGIPIDGILNRIS